jgi:putative hemolysin
MKASYSIIAARSGGYLVTASFNGRRSRWWSACAKMGRACAMAWLIQEAES